MSNAQIMIVEDQGVSAKDLRSTLIQLGYSAPVVVPSGEEAIRRVEESRPDLVLMDMVLRGPIDGIETAERIRSRHDIPIIYLTANAEDHPIARANQTAPYGYIIRPFEDRDVQTAIEIALFKHDMERRLRRSEELYRVLVESTRDMAIILLDRSGNVSTWNTGAAQMFGYEKTEIIGRNFSVFFTEEERRGKKPEEELTMAMASGRGADEGWRVRKDGSRFWAVVVSTALRSETGAVTGFTKFIHDATARKSAEDLLHKQEEALAFLVRQLATTNEELKGLIDITTSAINSLGLAELHDSLLSTLVQVMHADLAVISLLEDGVLRVSAGIGADQEGGIGFTVRPGEGVSGLVAQIRKPLRVADAQSDERVLNPFFRRFGIRTMIAVPLLRNGECIGVLTVAWRAERPENVREIRLLEIAGERCTMAIVNARLFEEEKRHQQELERSVAQRTAELAAANKELESFSYSVSHDLRTPLRAISGFAGALMEDYAGRLDPKADNYLRVIQRNTMLMGNLIDDLLAFSRLGRKELAKSEIDMSALARTIAEELRQEYADREPVVTVGDLPRALGDPAMIRQVFVNLLSNAMKFTHDRPVIEVGYRAEGTEIVYFVRDRGVGFDMAYSHKLFGVFQRLHPAEEFQGTGVGLAIVQRVISRHGGRVWAEGEAHHGATFYFTLG